jgi:hypothetical protein
MRPSLTSVNMWNWKGLWRTSPYRCMHLSVLSFTSLFLFLIFHHIPGHSLSWSEMTCSSQGWLLVATLPCSDSESPWLSWLTATANAIIASPVTEGTIVGNYPGCLDVVMDDHGRTDKINVTATCSLISILKVSGVCLFSLGNTLKNWLKGSCSCQWCHPFIAQADSQMDIPEWTVGCCKHLTAFNPRWNCAYWFHLHQHQHLEHPIMIQSDAHRAPSMSANTDWHVLVRVAKNFVGVATLHYKGVRGYELQKQFLLCAWPRRTRKALVISNCSVSSLWFSSTSITVTSLKKCVLQFVYDGLI